MPNPYLISSCMFQPRNTDNKCSIFNKMAVPIRHKWSPSSFLLCICFLFCQNLKDFHPPVTRSLSLSLFLSLPLPWDQNAISIFTCVQTHIWAQYTQACVSCPKTMRNHSLCPRTWYDGKVLLFSCMKTAAVTALAAVSEMSFNHFMCK